MTHRNRTFRFLSTPTLALALAGLTAALITDNTSAATKLDQDAGPAAAISITREGGQVKVIYAGTLQSAPHATGPWTNIAGASSPYSSGGSLPQRFFRSWTPTSIFSSTSVVTLKLTGPFQAYFDLAFAGQPDGIFPPVRPKPYFEGSLDLNGRRLPVSLRVRGNSSLQECPFPKMKFKVGKNDRPGTPFFDAREIKVGTHCAEGGRGPIGRLREETATYREALAYEAMALLEFITPRVRRAQVDYADTTPTNTAPAGGWQVSRQGFILDDIEVVAERLGGHALDDEEIAELTDANFDEQLITDLRVFHALLGNWDYALSVDGSNLWNTDVVELESGDLLPVAGDFDLASWVTASVALNAPHDYFPELPDLERQTRYELDQIKRSVSPEIFASARDRFAAKQAVLLSQANAALIDEPGRTNVLHHLSAFYEALDAVGTK